MLKFLASIDPKLFYLLVAGVTGGAIYLWRKLSLASWDAVTRGNPKIQALPALLLSGLLSSMPAVGKPLWSAVADILIGVAVGGGGSILGHTILKAAPGPYNGGKPKVDPAAPSERTTPPSRPAV